MLSPRCLSITEKYFNMQKFPVLLMSAKIWKISLFSYFSSSAIKILLELKRSIYSKLPVAYNRDLHSLDLCLPLVFRTSFLLDANGIWCTGGHFAQWVVDCVILALSTRAECSRFPYVLSHNFMFVYLWHWVL